MGKKRNNQNKKIRAKIAQDQKKFNQRKQQNNKRRDSSSSSEQNNLFDGYGRVSLEEKVTKKSPLISQVISEEKSDKPKLLIPRGLTNLGNTCYFNSVMQVMSQTPLLLHILNKKYANGVAWTAIPHNLMHEIEECKDSEVKSEVIETTLSESSNLYMAFVKFLREMQNNSRSSVTPNTLLNEIGKKCSQFRGRDQQDSHELLRNLLDAIKTDEVRRHRRSILVALNIKNTNTADDDTKAMVKNYGNASNFTAIDSLFGGYMISSVKCEECENSSEIFEPFFDLSLPICDGKPSLASVQPKQAVDKKIKPKEESNTTETVDLTKSDVTKLTTKERKQRRSQKKAAKRADRKGSQKVDEQDNGKCETGTQNVEPNHVEVDKAENEEKSNVSVSLNYSDPNSVNVQVDIVSPSSKTLDCNVKVNHTNETGTKTTECFISGDDCQSKAESIISESSISNNLAQDVEYIDADSEDEGISDCSDSKVDKLTTAIEKTLVFKDDNEENEIVSQTNQDCFGDTADAEVKNSRIRTTSINGAIGTLKMKKKWCLSSVMKRGEISDSTPTLESCLTAYTTAELLTGGNKLFCENCTDKAKKQGNDTKIYGNASKQIIIAYPPPVLTFHLKRFQAEGYRYVNLKKINRFVGFPFTLDMSPWVSPVYKVLGAHMGVKESESLKYSLYGIVQHSGGLRSGHYTAYVKLRNASATAQNLLRLKPFVSEVEKVLENIEPPESFESKCNPSCDNVEKSDGKWFHISDSHVTSVCEKQVLQSQAYILFYERIVESD